MKEKAAYMEKMDKAMEGVLEYLKRKGKLTELENDILLATQICQSSPFDSQAAKKKIMEFNAKYREVCSSILVTPGIKSKPLFDMKDEEVWESLWIQVEALCGRELGEIERGWMKEKNKDIVSPNLNGDGNSKSVTGFHIRLGIDTTYVEGNTQTGIILFRYAEGLLCYAEAAAELDKWSDDVLNKTLKPLRERAGVTWIEPQADANFPFTGLTPLIQEIRRERRSELALQGFRLDDLMRWAEAGTLKGINGRGRGAYLGEESVLYKSFSPKGRESLELVLKDNDGWMDPLQQYLPEGYLFDLNRDYLLPIPPDELQLNHELKQNPGWGDVSE